MNIGIDARSLVERKTGFGFFLSNMLIEILQIDKSNRYYLFSDRKIIFEAEQYKNVEFIQYTDSLFCPKSLYYYFRLARYIKSINIKLDVFWGVAHQMPRGFDSNVKKILTIHDFTHVRFPKSTTKYNLFITKLLLGPSIENSDNIVCISNNTKKELLEYYPTECIGKDIKVIYEGGYSKKEINKSNIDENNIRKDIIEIVKEKYILFVGTIEPRKNIKLLIEAAPKLSNKLKVVICGKIGWENKETINKLANTDNLYYFDYVSQAEKLYLMKNTFCQIQPSLYEGFGLPVVESMQTGTIVMVANNSSLSELIEMNELKFETNSVYDFIDKINNLQINRDIYNKAKIYCNKRGNEFSWNKAANEYLTLYK